MRAIESLTIAPPRATAIALTQQIGLVAMNLDRKLVLTSFSLLTIIITVVMSLTLTAQGPQLFLL